MLTNFLQELGLNYLRNLSGIISDTIAWTDSFDKAPNNYGVCYGDFVLHKLIVDINNIYLYDYSSCVYAPYAFDIACFVLSILEEKYLLTRDSKDILENNLIPWIRMGYLASMPIEGDIINEVHEMIRLKAAIALMSLSVTKTPTDNQLAKTELYSEILRKEDIYTPIDEYRKKSIIGDDLR